MRHEPCHCTQRLNEIMATWDVQVALLPGQNGAPDRPLLLVLDLAGQPLRGAHIAAAFCCFCGQRLRALAPMPAEWSTDDTTNNPALPEIEAAWNDLAMTARLGLAQEDQP